MGNGIQITNTVILGLIAIPLTFFIIAVLLMSLALGSSQGLLNFSTVIYFFIWISSIVYFIFLFLSFKRCNIENKNFKWAFYLNLVWIVMAILLFLGMMIYVISSLSENIFEGADLTDKANSNRMPI